jgi:hypothetical protein
MNNTATLNTTASRFALIPFEPQPSDPGGFRGFEFGRLTFRSGEAYSLPVSFGHGYEGLKSKSVRACRAYEMPDFMVEELLPDSVEFVGGERAYKNYTQEKDGIPKFRSPRNSFLSWVEKWYGEDFARSNPWFWVVEFKL